jgi:S1-C subfamily serine protease
MKRLFFIIAGLLTFVNISAQSLGASSPSKYQSGFGVLQKSEPQISLLKIDTDEIKKLDTEKFLISKPLRTLNIKADTFEKTRSVKDAALFKSIAPSVVLIVTDDSLGSGSIINNSGGILTNLHVVGKNKEVGVIFKPLRDTDKVTKNDVYRATVVRVDEVTDLALLNVIDFPVSRIPIRLGNVSEISIGTDVHAIGHPRGESWTYTKGIISQYRNDYQWSSGEGEVKHRADVIQTQTPINPGNSGGPLISDAGTLIGVNSFKTNDSEGLNFAVSIDDVKNFLARKDSRVSTESKKSKDVKKCEWRTIYEGKTDDKTGEMISYDTQCSGKTDLEIIFPYDKSKPYYLRADRNLDGKIDLLIWSYSRNEKWTISYWDNDFDGKWDSVGFHPNGEITPTRYEDYNAFISRTAKK